MNIIGENVFLKIESSKKIKIPDASIILIIKTKAKIYVNILTTVVVPSLTPVKNDSKQLTLLIIPKIITIIIYRKIIYELLIIFTPNVCKDNCNYSYNKTY